MFMMLVRMKFYKSSNMILIDNLKLASLGLKTYYFNFTIITNSKLTFRV